MPPLPLAAVLRHTDGAILNRESLPSATRRRDSEDEMSQGGGRGGGLAWSLEGWPGGGGSGGVVVA